jgi:hypothetical protein
MSHQDQDAEIGRLVREHGDRRREYLTISAKLNRIGTALKQASEKLINADAQGYSGNTFDAKRVLQGLADEVDMRQLLALVEEHADLTLKLKREQEMLNQYGIEH